MSILGKGILITLINALAIYLAQEIIVGFSAPTELYALLTIGFILTALNFTLRPLLNIALLPIVFLTFGLFSFVINMGMLFILDYLREDVMIAGFVPLILGTIFISFINLICQRLLLPKS